MNEAPRWLAEKTTPESFCAPEFRIGRIFGVYPTMRWLTTPFGDFQRV